MQPIDDPVIDEVREIRHQISERLDNNPERLVAYYIEMQQKYRDRLVTAAAASEATDHTID